MNRQIRVGKIGGAAEHFWQGLGKRTQRILTGFAGRQRLAFGRACGDQASAVAANSAASMPVAL